MKSAYTNLYNLLRDQISEETYLGIVRNKILVDVQGNDVSTRHRSSGSERASLFDFNHFASLTNFLLLLLFFFFKFYKTYIPLLM